MIQGKFLYLVKVRAPYVGTDLFSVLKTVSSFECLACKDVDPEIKSSQDMIINNKDNIVPNLVYASRLTVIFLDPLTVRSWPEYPSKQSYK